VKLPVYTYSFLNTYDTCPKQAFHRYVLKDIKFVATEQIKWGNTVHDAMDARVGKGTPLPVECARYEKYAAAFDGLNPLAESKVAITRDGSPVSYWDDAVWFRGKADVVLEQNGIGLFFDWKTGNSNYESPYELELHAMAFQAAHPHIEKITARYVWLKDDKLGRAYDVSNVGETLECLQEKADEIEMRFKQGIWPTKVGPLCGWCPVTSCGFNKAKDRR
jgi:hypothetical protein